MINWSKWAQNALFIVLAAIIILAWLIPTHRIFSHQAPFSTTLPFKR